VPPGPSSFVPDGFEAIPLVDVELGVTESSRHGSPMTLVRGGEDRDLAAIVAMGQNRADQLRFHIDRDVDFVKYVITKKRLLAGLASPGTPRVTVRDRRRRHHCGRLRRDQHCRPHMDARGMRRS
jgi:hypothetical protein